MRSRRRRRRAPELKALRSLSLQGGAIFLYALLLWSWGAVWFVRHPRAWIEERTARHPVLAAPLLELGDPLADVTDALGLTGSDACRIVARPAPHDSILFAGAPRRIGAPAPDDIVILDRGDFLVGWSPRLRHPAWCAYHVPAAAPFPSGKRPNFRPDKAIRHSPLPSDYTRTGFDRGHMAPNYAITTRFGPLAQEKTFLMSNISPQTPALNRGVWREIEHRIAEFWTDKWGEVWVIVGALSDGRATLPGSGIDIPARFYQLIVAQQGREVRALALLIEQDVPLHAWPTRYIVSIDELEAITGFDFLAELDDADEAALEAQCPTRLWPVSFSNALRLLRQGHEL